MRLGLVNRFYPPDPAPTGIEAQILAGHLVQALPDASVTVFTTTARYRRNRSREAPITPGIRVVRLASSDLGRAPLPRLLGSLIDGYRLARQASRSCDLVISLTDPPLLSLWLQAAARRSGCRWFEWTMDLYPELLVASGRLGAGDLFYRWLLGRSSRLRPEGRLCLGPAQQAFLERQRSYRPPTVILPTGLRSSLTFAPDPPWDAAPVIACAGNYGEAHPPGALMALVEAAGTKGWRFLLALHGSQAPMLRQRLANHPAVTWRDHLGEAELMAASAHFVPLKRTATHLCVPSRALTALCLGCPVIFAGDPEADTWRLLARGGVPAGWLLPEQVNGHYRAIDLERVVASVSDPAERARCTQAARQRAREIRADYHHALTQLIGWLRSETQEDA